MLKILKIILYPVSLLYGLAVMMRNKLFDWKFIKAERFDIPVICVGNLCTGGTGKTPHVEYLIKLLSVRYKVGVLSRGYKRKTKGFLTAEINDKVGDIGDEVKQIAVKFNNVFVAVCEKRRIGIKKMRELRPDLDIVLLDDAFQHRYVKPGMSILLTDYSSLYIHDFVIPSGTLREFVSGASRADIICVTKSPKVLSPIVSKDIESKLKLKEMQKLIFSYITYGNFISLYKDSQVEMPKKVYAILLFAGIVNTYPLEEYLKTKCEELTVLKYADHHQYTVKEVELIVKRFDDLYSVNKMIVTTEKDAMRLENDVFKNILSNYPVFYVPIETEIHKKYKNDFDNQILEYVRKNKTNR